MNNNDKPEKVVEDKHFIGMWRLEWADGVLSEDMYSLTRARDILKNYDEYRYYMTMRGNKRAISLDRMP